VELLRWLVSGVSAHRPDHTITIAGQYMPLEARLGGLFVGFLVCLVYLLALGRARAWLLPTGWTTVVLLLGVTATGLDGFNATLHDLGRAYFYTPGLTARLFTGLTAGFGVAAFTLPVVAASVWREGDYMPSIDGVAELAVGYALLGLLAVVVQLDAEPLYVAITLLHVIAVVATFLVADVYLLLTALRRTRLADAWSDLLPVGVAGLCLALLKLSALALLRSQTG
jgi:uncharacterized membrane protein